MTVPDPHELASGMDPRPRSTPVPPLGDTVPDPTRPGDPRRPVDPTTPRPTEPTTPDGRLRFVATGRDDRYRHVVEVEVEVGDVGDPVGLPARCGAAVERVVPGLRAEQADCPGCRTASVLPS